MNDRGFWRWFWNEARESFLMFFGKEALKQQGRELLKDSLSFLRDMFGFGLAIIPGLLVLAALYWTATLPETEVARQNVEAMRKLLTRPALFCFAFGAIFMRLYLKTWGRPEPSEKPEPSTPPAPLPPNMNDPYYADEDDDDDEYLELGLGDSDDDWDMDDEDTATGLPRTE